MPSNLQVSLQNAVRTAKRVAITGTVLLLFFVFQWTVTRSYSSRTQIPVFKDGQQTTATESDPDWPSPGDKVVVMAKMKTENTDWVAENLPDWQHAIYHMDEPEAVFHVPKNKGRESMAYLTYLIDHYGSLPSTVAFLHSHRDGWPGGWHTDAAGYDNVISLQTLQISYVQEAGYANLRCLHNPGCPDEIQPFRDPRDPERPVEHAMPEAWSAIFGNASAVPPVIGVACCSQFAVSRTQILSRPLQDYVMIRDWLLHTPLSDYISGRILEYLWHIIFGRDPVHCPASGSCYCDVYGKCV